MSPSDDLTAKHAALSSTDGKISGKMPRLSTLLGAAMPAAFDTYRSLGVDGEFPIPDMVEALTRLQETHQILKNFRITFVDDNRELLVEYTPGLQLLTDGKATLIHQRGQSAETLVEQIERSNPEILLLDYFLVDGETPEGKPLENEQFTGGDITRLIRRREPPEKGVIIIGFSSDSMYPQFVQAGVNGAVTKLADHGEDLPDTFSSPVSEMSLVSVGRIVQDLLQRSTPPSRSLSLKGFEDSSADMTQFRQEESSPYFDRTENYLKNP